MSEQTMKQPGGKLKQLRQLFADSELDREHFEVASEWLSPEERAALWVLIYLWLYPKRVEEQIRPIELVYLLYAGPGLKEKDIGVGLKRLVSRQLVSPSRPARYGINQLLLTKIEDGIIRLVPSQEKED